MAEQVDWGEIRHAPWHGTQGEKPAGGTPPAMKVCGQKILSFGPTRDHRAGEIKRKIRHREADIPRVAKRPDKGHRRVLGGFLVAQNSGITRHRHVTFSPFLATRQPA